MGLLCHSACLYVPRNHRVPIRLELAFDSRTNIVRELHPVITTHLMAGNGPNMWTMAAIVTGVSLEAETFDARTYGKGWRGVDVKERVETAGDVLGHVERHCVGSTSLPVWLFLKPFLFHGEYGTGIRRCHGTGI